MRIETSFNFYRIFHENQKFTIKFQSGTFRRHQHYRGVGQGHVRLKEGPGEFWFVPLKMLNFNAYFAESFTKLTMSRSQDNLLDKGLCTTEIDLYMYMYVKLILVTL